MQKPSGYDEAPVMGNYEKISPGGHVLEIKKVEECIASNGNAYVNVIFDTDITDSQPNTRSSVYTKTTQGQIKSGAVINSFLSTTITTLQKPTANSKDLQPVLRRRTRDL